MPTNSSKRTSSSASSAGVQYGGALMAGRSNHRRERSQRPHEPPPSRERSKRCAARRGSSQRARRAKAGSRAEERLDHQAGHRRRQLLRRVTTTRRGADAATLASLAGMLSPDGVDQALAKGAPAKVRGRTSAARVVVVADERCSPGSAGRRRTSRIPRDFLEHRSVAQRNQERLNPRERLRGMDWLA